MRAVLAASCLGLLATSAPPHYRYHFNLAPITTTTDLTGDVPTRVYRVALRANALGQDGVSTTRNAHAYVYGKISSAGLEQGTPEPAVAFDVYDPDSTIPHEPRLATTEVSRGFSPVFQGDCQTFDPATPCEASFVVELSRTDAGASGGLVSIPWSLQLSSDVNKPTSPNVGPLDLPWNVSVEEL